MKKIVCIIAVLSLVLFAGCGSNKSVDEADGKKLMIKFCRVFLRRTTKIVIPTFLRIRIRRSITRLLRKWQPNNALRI